MIKLHTPSFLQGVEVGRRLKARRLQRQPVAFLYNGVRLPALPEWDKTVYPYAYIATVETSYSLFLCGAQPYCRTEGFVATGPSARYNASSNGSWVLSVETTTANQYQNFSYGWSLVWSMQDFRNEDGTTYLAASEPVPVYE